MKQSLGKNTWSLICLYLVCVGCVMAYILPSACQPGENIFIQQSEVEAVCNKTSDDRYREAPHYADEDVFLSKTYEWLVDLVIIGNVTSLHRQNFTENAVLSKGENHVARTLDDSCRITQEYYIMDIEVTCILKYKKISNAVYFFPLPRTVFFESDCPPRDITVGDEVIASVGFYSHDVTCSSEGYCKPVQWKFGRGSFHKRDARVLGEIMKSCGFQDDMHGYLRPEACPAIHGHRRSCIDRTSASGRLSKGSLVISIIYMLFVMVS